MTYGEIARKQVINIRSGALLGVVSDVEFDPCDWLICAIYVTPETSCIKKLLPWLFNKEVLHIDIKEIENISGDVILVRFS